MLVAISSMMTPMVPRLPTVPRFKSVAIRR
jgi:hypothetical protein